MNKKIAAVFFTLFLAIPITSVAQAQQGDQKASLEIGKTSSLGQSFGFKFKGQLLQIPILGDGIINQRTVSLYVYYPADGSAAYVVSGSPLRMAEMLRTEYPDGVDSKSAKDVIQYFVLGCWGEQNCSVASRGLIEIFEERIKNIPKERLSELLTALFDLPNLKIKDNDWRLQVTIVGDNNTIQINTYTGALKPFSIDEVTTKVIFDPKRPFQNISLDTFTEENLLLAIENKNNYNTNRKP